jgi:hypothetical protein
VATAARTLSGHTHGMKTKGWLVGDVLTKWHKDAVCVQQHRIRPRHGNLLSAAWLCDKKRRVLHLELPLQT